MTQHRTTTEKKNYGSSLPPRVQGPVVGELTVQLGFLRWSLTVRKPLQYVFRALWWGEKGKGAFLRPKNAMRKETTPSGLETGEDGDSANDILRDASATLFYPLRLSQVTVMRYLRDARTLHLDLVEFPKGYVLGRVAVPVIAIAPEKSAGGRYPVVTPQGKTIGDVTIRFRLHFFEKHEMPSVAAYEEPTERARTEIASPRQEAKAKGEEQLTAEEFKRPPEYDADGYEEAAEGARALDALDMAEAVEFSATERQAQLQGGEEEETLLLPRAPPKPHTAAVEALPSKKRTIDVAPPKQQRVVFRETEPQKSADEEDLSELLKIAVSLRAEMDDYLKSTEDLVGGSKWKSPSSRAQEISATEATVSSSPWTVLSRLSLESLDGEGTILGDGNPLVSQERRRGTQGDSHDVASAPRASPSSRVPPPPPKPRDVHHDGVVVTLVSLSLPKLDELDESWPVVKLRPPRSSALPERKIDCARLVRRRETSEEDEELWDMSGPSLVSSPAQLFLPARLVTASRDYGAVEVRRSDGVLLTVLVLKEPIEWARSISREGAREEKPSRDFAVTAPFLLKTREAQARAVVKAEVRVALLSAGECRRYLRERCLVRRLPISLFQAWKVKRSLSTRRREEDESLSETEQNTGREVNRDETEGEVKGVEKGDFSENDAIAVNSHQFCLLVISLRPYPDLKSSLPAQGSKKLPPMLTVRVTGPRADEGHPFFDLPKSHTAHSLCPVDFVFEGGRSRKEALAKVDGKLRIDLFLPGFGGKEEGLFGASEIGAYELRTLAESYLEKASVDESGMVVSPPVLHNSFVVKVQKSETKARGEEGRGDRFDRGELQVQLSYRASLAAQREEPTKPERYLPAKEETERGSEDATIQSATPFDIGAFPWQKHASLLYSQVERTSLSLPRRCRLRVRIWEAAGLKTAFEAAVRQLNAGVHRETTLSHAAKRTFPLAEVGGPRVEFTVNVHCSAERLRGLRGRFLAPIPSFSPQFSDSSDEASIAELCSEFFDVDDAAIRSIAEGSLLVEASHLDEETGERLPLCFCAVPLLSLLYSAEGVHGWQTMSQASSGKPVGGVRLAAQLEGPTGQRTAPTKAGPVRSEAVDSAEHQKESGRWKLTVVLEEVVLYAAVGVQEGAEPEAPSSSQRERDAAAAPADRLQQPTVTVLFGGLSRSLFPSLQPARAKGLRKDANVWRLGSATTFMWDTPALRSSKLGAIASDAIVVTVTIPVAVDGRSGDTRKGVVRIPLLSLFALDGGEEDGEEWCGGVYALHEAASKELFGTLKCFFRALPVSEMEETDHGERVSARSGEECEEEDVDKESLKERSADDGSRETAPSEGAAIETMKTVPSACKVEEEELQDVRTAPILTTSLERSRNDHDMMEEPLSGDRVERKGTDSIVRTPVSGEELTVPSSSALCAVRDSSELLADEEDLLSFSFSFDGHDIIAAAQETGRELDILTSSLLRADSQVHSDGASTQEDYRERSTANGSFRDEDKRPATSESDQLRRTPCCSPLRQEVRPEKDESLHLIPPLEDTEANRIYRILFGR